jgi:hypothetical protein
MKTIPEVVTDKIPSYLSVQDRKRLATVNKHYADRVGRMLAIKKMPIHEKLAALELHSNRALFDREELMNMMRDIRNDTLLLHFMRDLPRGGWLVKELETLYEERIATRNYRKDIKRLLIEHYLQYLLDLYPFSRIERLINNIESREVLSRLMTIYIRLRQQHPEIRELSNTTLQKILPKVDPPTHQLLLQAKKNKDPTA